MFDKVFIIVFLLKLKSKVQLVLSHNGPFLQLSEMFLLGMKRSQGDADRNEFTKRNYI